MIEDEIDDPLTPAIHIIVVFHFLVKLIIPKLINPLYGCIPSFHANFHLMWVSRVIEKFIREDLILDSNK